MHVQQGQNPMDVIALHAPLVNIPLMGMCVLYAQWELIHQEELHRVPNAHVVLNQVPIKIVVYNVMQENSVHMVFAFPALVTPSHLLINVHVSNVKMDMDQME